MTELKRRFSVLGVIIMGFLMGAMFVLGGLAAYKFYFPEQVVAEDSSSSGQIKIGPSDITETVKKVSPAVVFIESYTEVQTQNPVFQDPFFRQFFGDGYNPYQQQERSKGFGSGFIFDKSGLIITNEHVISNASEINVIIDGFDKPVRAKVIGADGELDLAVLKVDVQKDLPVIKLGESTKAEVGNWVVAIGNPYGLDHTVTVGVISAKGRPVTISNRLYKNLLQTDAAINPGNSGGPLLNTAGEVIGINTAVNASAQGIGFAIPTATVKEVLSDLVNKGKVVKSYIGVYLQPLDDDLVRYFGAPGKDGAVISHVAPNGPAERAGLQQGDIILEINKKKVKNPDDITEVIKRSKVGEKLVFSVYRDRHTEFITIKTAEKP